eukprot:CAMPEP_0184690874 /NCGR_PEP_ID=MMETSP0312-20130426/31485_1 /TAXON_ID=31354 /ORGANISM="Compsopogon coeruleus, Strain SAG 36.94" /LENGTH=170 /DNA_ID=CAMNT_0027148445 /DNA_START=154 /DNA_END=666 /DNA_ORIENTATION=+
MVGMMFRWFGRVDWGIPRRRRRRGFEGRQCGESEGSGVAQREGSSGLASGEGRRAGPLGPEIDFSQPLEVRFGGRDRPGPPAAEGSSLSCFRRSASRIMLTGSMFLGGTGSQPGLRSGSSAVLVRERAEVSGEEGDIAVVHTKAPTLWKEMLVSSSSCSERWWVSAGFSK